MDQDRFDRSKRLGWFELERVRSANITVVGCGALGNEVVKDLVLSGFRKIVLVDMDMVQGSNMNRCLFFTRKDMEEKNLKVNVVKKGALSLDPGLDIKVHASRVEDLDSDVINDSDVVMGCLDNIAARIHVNAHSKASGIPYIDGATDGMVGKVQVVLDEGPCLECNMNRSHMRIMNIRKSCTGEEFTFFEPRVAGEITTTSVVAAIQVREALKVVHGLGDKVMRGAFYYDGMRNEGSVLELHANPRCPHHAEGKATLALADDGSSKDRSEEVEKVG